MNDNTASYKGETPINNHPHPEERQYGDFFPSGEREQLERELTESKEHADVEAAEHDKCRSELTASRAEVDKLKGERDESRAENYRLRNKLREECTHRILTVADRDRLHCEREKSRAEVARLREALDYEIKLSLKENELYELRMNDGPQSFKALAPIRLSNVRRIMRMKAALSTPEQPLTQKEQNHEIHIQ